MSRMAKRIGLGIGAVVLGLSAVAAVSRKARVAVSRRLRGAAVVLAGLGGPEVRWEPSASRSTAWT